MANNSCRASYDEENARMVNDEEGWPVLASVFVRARVRPVSYPEP